jgi:tetrahydromethanopterin S-methyltransferase subunit G
MTVTMRENWTDERLDDLNAKVDQGFAETKLEMREGFARVDKDIGELRVDLKDLHGEMNERFDALNGRLIGGFFVLVAAIIGSNAF